MSAIVRDAGRWTLRLCAGCRTRRCMPASEAVCRRCAPGRGPRSWRLQTLRKERLAAGLAPEDLAARAGVSVATVRRAECGRRVRTEAAVKMAEALGTGVLELASNTEE